jgi:hypothetical protein
VLYTASKICAKRDLDECNHSAILFRAAHPNGLK